MMMHSFLYGLPFVKGARSRAINAENRTGEKGKGGMAAGPLGPSRKGSPKLILKAGENTVLADIHDTGVITHIWITVPHSTPMGDFALCDLVLRMYWEDSETPAVECPLGDFFCNGFGEIAPYQSLPMMVLPANGFNCYFPMPFRRAAKITVENQHDADLGFYYQIDYCLYDELPEDMSYFCASWRRERVTQLRRDYTILDGVKGPGRYVGTYVALTTLERYWWGEGEVKFYIDGDTEYPTICGTGMEDYFGGSYSCAKQENGETVEQLYNSSFMGYPFHSRNDRHRWDYHESDCPAMRGFYRWHLLDPIFFEEDLRVTVQQIGVNKFGKFERQDDVASVAYWYQALPHTSFPPLPEKQLRWPR